MKTVSIVPFLELMYVYISVNYRNVPGQIQQFASPREPSKPEPQTPTAEILPAALEFRDESKN